MSLFITCGSDLENLLIEELHELGIKKTAVGFRGVYVQDTSMDTIYRINYCSRIAGRVLFPLARFICHDQKGLYHGASKVDWNRYIPKGKTFAIDANVHHKNLRNSLFAAQVVKDAICDQIRDLRGSRPDVDVQEPDIQLNLFIHNGQTILSFDTSGQPLHKRGYRLDAGEAPLQESLAAALLRLAKYTGEEVLLDPCCGSGTFLTEAALIATRTPPGYLRKNWGFMNHPDFNLQQWLKVKNTADDNRRLMAKQKIWGCDKDAHMVHVCKLNLRAAGVQQYVELVQSDFREFTPIVQPNFLITNPPHGKRLDNVLILAPLYRALGEFMKHKMAKPSKGFVFVGNLELTKEVGLAPKQRHVINSSGIDSRLLEFEIY